jgi:hypothetical protein
MDDGSTRISCAGSKKSQENSRVQEASSRKDAKKQTSVSESEKT